MANYELLSKNLIEQMQRERESGSYKKLAFDETLAHSRKGKMPLQGYFTPFTSDINQIMRCPNFSRYADKTQVYSLFKNDDMTRRSLHVQFVSRISRTIGEALHLNLNLIEAIALGHDIGHPAFAHSGEHLLDKFYSEHTGRRFLHNIHSVRVLSKIHGYDLHLETLNGIAAHNGELELDEYRPVELKTFEEFDEIIERCYQDKKFANKIMPCTLEGAVVRISDIIAYLGKDREDAILARAVNASDFKETALGKENAEMVNNLIVNVIENSYGKPYIKLDHAHFEALRRAKRENYEKIYNHAGAHTGIGEVLEPMMRNIYEQLLEDVKKQNKTSPIFTHHIGHVNRYAITRETPYEEEEPNQLVVDYIASMTDDYLIELHDFLFKNSKYKVKYRGYFD